MSIMERRWKYKSRMCIIQKLIWIVANDDVFKCVNMFMDGIWNEERKLEEIRFFRKNDQIAFLTQQIIDDVVRFKQSYEVAL